MSHQTAAGSVVRSNKHSKPGPLLGDFIGFVRHFFGRVT